jgi:hypothetical protein
MGLLTALCGINSLNIFRASEMRRFLVITLPQYKPFLAVLAQNLILRGIVIPTFK